MNWSEEGESGLLLTWPDCGEEERRGRILSLAQALAAAPPVWLRECVPGAASLLLVLDPLAIEPAAARAAIRGLGGGQAAARPGRRVEVPVKYGGAEGPDLERVAAHAGLSPEEVIRRHSARELEVAFLGFAPGFPYLAGLPPELRAPRLSTPRPRVPAGSVAIAGEFSGIYPRESPGGWNLIGRTHAVLCDWARDQPILLAPGDRVAFVPVDSLPQAAEERRAAEAPEGPGPVAALETAGLLATVQDLGRPGHAHRGVPPSGPMDPLAFRLANLAAGNEEGSPALELAFPASAVRFLERTSFALGGADFAARLSGRPVPLYERVDARAGDLLRFEVRRAGEWATLALAGGLGAGRVLGSAAADLRSGIGARLGKGARLALGGPPPADGRTIPAGSAPLPQSGAVVRVVAPEAGLPEGLGGAEVALALARDRAGYRADAPLFPGGAGSLPSEGIPPGTVQLPPDGRLIFLLAEMPTTGGYRKAAFVASVDRRLVAQSPVRGRLKLAPITPGEARGLWLEEEAWVRSLAGRKALGSNA